MQIIRPFVAELLQALAKPERDLLEVLVGPRQVGKTTAAEQVAARIATPTHFAAGDSPAPHPACWIESQWRIAQALGPNTLLVLDEIQKIQGWSEAVKLLWDARRRGESPLRVLLLGSSALLLQRGLSESLSGRFFLHRAMHWTWPECREAFGWSLEQWIFFGGYPGAARFASNEREWKQYVLDSLIETVLARDILQMQTVHKPALLRQLFSLAAVRPAQILSYNKMLGELQDAGNTTTLAHYLRLLETAFLVSGLEMFSKGATRQRGSSPKLILWNNALVNALSTRSFEESRADHSWWGRLVENAVGAKFLNELTASPWSITYWRHRDREVDFIITDGRRLWAVEVKSGLIGDTYGMEAFLGKYPGARPLWIGVGGIPLEQFFEGHVEDFLT